VLGNVITSGIKLMVLAVIIGIGSTLFASVTDAFRTGDDVTLAQVMGTVLAAIVFFWMGIFAPGVASGLITGAPQLGAGSAAGAVAGAAAGTYVAGAGGRAAIGAAAGGASSAVKAGASMAGAARTSYTLGSVASGTTGVGAVAAGVAGMARAGSDAIRRTAGRPAQSLKDAYRRGSQGAWRATGGSGGSDGSGSSTSSSSPGWARRMQARQSASQAGQMAAHSLRDGDRGSSGAAPQLNDKDE
jgi:type IV secretion system protein TrbL